MSSANYKSRRNKILEHLKSNALSIPQLQELVGPQNSKKCRWILYDQLREFSDWQELMNLGAVVILLQIQGRNSSPVGHFILLLDHGSHIEHFDSYGFNMDEELSITHEQPYLTQLFKFCRKKIVDNTLRLQQMKEDINTCGRWVVARLLLRELELPDFTGIIKYFIRPADDLVAAMTILLAFKR